MARTASYLLIAFALLGCSDNYEKIDVSYGQEIFTAEYDAIMAEDKLSLFDNKLFRIEISNTSANGEYEVSTDTLKLNYYVPNDLFPSAYLLNGSEGWLHPLTMQNEGWVVDSLNDCGFSPTKNELKKLNN